MYALSTFIFNNCASTNTVNMSFTSYFMDLLIYVCIVIYNVSIRRKSEPVPKKCLVGKTAIVTGGNSGIGLALVNTLASRGCKVIIADCQNAEQTRDVIKDTTGNDQIFYKFLDLSSFKSIRKFADEIVKTEEKIDILINNAGVGVTKKLVSEDGLNYVMQVNIFGAFLLTHLLLEPLKKAKSARVIFVSSITAYMNNISRKRLNITDYQMTDDYILSLYSNSKACCIVAAKEFGRRLEKYGITANSLDPLGVKTKILDNIGEFGNTPLRLILIIGIFIFGQHPLAVAKHFLDVITKNDATKTNGNNYILSFPIRAPWILRNKKFTEDVFSKMEDLVQLKSEERIN